MLQHAYGEDGLSRTQYYEWYQRSKSGRTSIEYDPKSGRPSSSTGDDHIEKVRENRRLTVREVSEEVCICKSSCHTILTENLKMHRVAAKFVPRLLTEEQKQNRVIVSQELLDRSNTDENLLKNVITGDEKWVYGYDAETEVQSSQWVGKSSSRPKKAWQCRSNVKVMLIVFFFIGRVLFIMSLFHVVRQSIKSFTWRSWSVWGKQCEGRGLRRGQTRPGCCTITMHLPTRRFLSVNFWRSKRWLSCPSPPTLQIWPLRTFSCSQSWSPP